MENSRSTTLQLIYLNTAFAVIGCLAALSAVLLILLTKAYHQYVHRLQLYLAILCLGFAAAVGLETLPVSTDVNATVTVREGWGDACVAIGCIVQYFGFNLLNVLHVVDMRLRFHGSCMPDTITKTQT